MTGSGFLVAAQVFALKATQPIGVGAIEADLDRDRWSALIAVDLDLAKLLDDHLSVRRTWMCGESPTIADYSLATPLMHAQKAQVSLAPYPQLSGWFGRVQQLEAWRRTEP